MQVRVLEVFQETDGGSLADEFVSLDVPTLDDLEDSRQARYVIRKKHRNEVASELVECEVEGLLGLLGPVIEEGIPLGLK